jgi:site-specific DNA recombinase
MSKKIKDNEGEVPQYYVQNSHPAIIEPDEFDVAQVELERRRNMAARSMSQPHVDQAS